MNQLRHMSVFAHVVESGSITAAAESLGLSKSVVSQHLKTLENELGLTLLKRTTRRQHLTPAGQTFYSHCKRLNEVADQAWHEALQVRKQPKGRIRITAPHALMDSLVVPAIEKVLQECPELIPEFVSSDAQLDLMTEKIDLAIRVGASRDSSLKQRRIGEFRDILCGVPALCKAPFGDHRYIANVWEGKNITYQMTDPDGNKIDFESMPKCIANSFHTCLKLIRSGFGIGLLPDFIVNEKSSGLKPLFPGYKLPLNPIYALHSFDKELPINVQVCLKAIEQEFSSRN